MAAVIWGVLIWGAVFVAIAGAGGATLFFLLNSARTRARRRDLDDDWWTRQW